MYLHYLALHLVFLWPVWNVTFPCTGYRCAAFFVCTNCALNVTTSFPPSPGLVHRTSGEGARFLGRFRRAFGGMPSQKNFKCRINRKQYYIIKICIFWEKYIFLLCVHQMCTTDNYYLQNNVLTGFMGIHSECGWIWH